jgi:hypothetical protein
MMVSSDGNVGIGTAPDNPTQKLEVAGGGFKLNSTVGTKSACNDDAHRGTMWFTQGSGSTDKLEICGKDAAGNFSSKTIAQW